MYFLFYKFAGASLQQAQQQTRLYTNTKSAAGIINRRRGLTNAYSSGNYYYVIFNILYHRILWKII